MAGNERGGAHSVGIRYGISRTRMGCLLVARTGTGVCSVDLSDRFSALTERLRRLCPGASLRRDDAGLKKEIAAAAGVLEGREPKRLPLDLRGTAFQYRVWEEISKIRYGKTKTYTELAEAAGRPKAVRAVANACGSNPVPLLIPCHRVVRKGGALGGYGLGPKKKKMILAAESIGGLPGDKKR